MVNKHMIKRVSLPPILDFTGVSPEFNRFTLGNMSIELGYLLGATGLVDLSLSGTRVLGNTPF